MPTATGHRYSERRSDLSSVTFKGQVTIDSETRDLKLILAHSPPDEDADSFEFLVSPLKVLLVELLPPRGGSAERKGYEDMYLFTHDGNFMSHLYRKFTRGKNRLDEYDETKFSTDSDISKLFRYGEAIRDMIGPGILDYPLEHHPTVERLRTHTLWQ